MRQLRSSSLLECGHVNAAQNQPKRQGAGRATTEGMAWGFVGEWLSVVGVALGLFYLLKVRRG
ncbi:MAG TPA: hypothetical protein VEH05_11195 [Streptosporangiaceae bacterium]|nr:hypothetical protein [Streptosporangiaceae bacterium]